MSPAELLAFVLLGVAVLLVPSALACALFYLAREDRRRAAEVAAPAAARHSPRRAWSRSRRPPHRGGPPGRRFPGR